MIENEPSTSHEPTFIIPGAIVSWCSYVLVQLCPGAMLSAAMLSGAMLSSAMLTRYQSQQSLCTLQLPMIQIGQLGIDFLYTKGFVNSLLNVPAFTKPGCYECQ